MGTTSIEDVAAAAPGGRNWFQLYMWKDRDRSMALVDRAAAAGYDTLLVTVDVPVAGARLRDVRNGMTIPPTLTPRTVANAIPRPAWWINFLTTEPLAFASLDSWSGHGRRAAGHDVRPDRDLRRPRLDQGAVARARSSSRACRRVDDARRLRRRRASTPSCCPTTVAASSTGRRSRSTCCPQVVDGGRPRRRGAPRHRHHVRPGHRRRGRARRPLHADRSGLPVRPDGRWPRRRRPHHRDPARARSSGPCGCSA